MEITGKNFIGDRLSGIGEEHFRTFNPFKNIENKILFISATTAELKEAVTLADTDFPIYRELPNVQRASFLKAIGDEIIKIGLRNS